MTVFFGIFHKNPYNPPQGAPRNTQQFYCVNRKKIFTIFYTPHQMKQEEHIAFAKTFLYNENRKFQR